MNPLAPVMGTILIADDDADDRRMVEEAFSCCEARYVLQFAEDVADLLEWLRHIDPSVATKQTSLPDLILLDLNMPRMNSLEPLRAIKADSRCCAIPVVVWTTSHSAADRDASFWDGAEQFFVKAQPRHASVDSQSPSGRHLFGVADMDVRNVR